MLAYNESQIYASLLVSQYAFLTLLKEENEVFEMFPLSQEITLSTPPT